MKKKGNKVIIGVITLVLVLVGLNVYQFLQNRDLKRNQNLTTEQKNQKLIDEVNKVYTLPANETPVVAVVTDPEEFKKQYPVFDNVQSGDYLLFYRKARLNVLYRQTDKKVIKTASVNVPIAIEIVGSEEATNAVEEALKTFGTQVTVTKTVKDGITQSFVFDVDSDQENETSTIAKALGLETGSTLPTSFSPSSQTELVVAVADDYKAPAQSGADSGTDASANDTTQP